MNAEKTGSLISQLRKEKGITQKQLADMLYVSDKAISRWETGKGFPEISMIEDLSKALDVSMVELLRGERMEDVSSKDMKDFADEGFRTYRSILDHQKARTFISGILISMMALILVLVHLNSPIHFESSENVVRIETIDDKLVAVLDAKVCDYEKEEVHVDGDSVFISCYTTRWHELFGKKEEKIAILGDKSVIDYVFYYPGEDGDELIYYYAKAPSYGVESLPRLIYNGWLVIGAALSIISTALYLIFRKKYCARTLFRIASFFVSFTLSVLVIVKGNTRNVYNAMYYFSGILLMTLCLTLFVNLIYRSRIRKQ